VSESEDYGEKAKVKDQARLVKGSGYEIA